MDDTSKKADRNKQSQAHAKWEEKLAPKPGQAPSGVRTFVGLLRRSPSDESAYELFQTLDMSSSLLIRQEDVVHLEELAPDKSPFGTLGGSKVFVRLGAEITSIRTSTSTFTAGSSSPDDFDLDIRLGGGAGRSADISTGPQTIPDTGCGNDCETIPPFTDPDTGCASPQTILNCPTLGCIPTKAGISICYCAPFTQVCITQNTCQNTCQTCQTQCGRICFVPHTRIFTACNPRGCVFKA
jgi:hypothetical protein